MQQIIILMYVTLFEDLKTLDQLLLLADEFCVLCYLILAIFSFTSFLKIFYVPLLFCNIQSDVVDFVVTF